MIAGRCRRFRQRRRLFHSNEIQQSMTIHFEENQFIELKEQTESKKERKTDLLDGCVGIGWQWRLLDVVDLQCRISERRTGSISVSHKN